MCLHQKSDGLVGSLHPLLTSEGEEEEVLGAVDDTSHLLHLGIKLKGMRFAS